ncbi:MAG: HD family hydrolase [Labilithrix sp.]|nr:HD family hydrolase [Labilithrix sp.]MCW5813422.1 HD family hydrolase [Labilithrix sp.]
MPAASASAASAVELVQLFDRLASLPRTGWLLRGVVDPESIAEHSFGVAVVASLIVDDLRANGTAVDGERVLRMALVHDVAEAFTGDVPMPAKSEALRSALAAAEEATLAPVLTPAQLALWREAEEATTLEARVVKAADKLQMLVKALTYEQQRRGHLDEFFVGDKNRRHMDLDFARTLLAEIDRLRDMTARDGA